MAGTHFEDFLHDSDLMEDSFSHLTEDLDNMDMDIPDKIHFENPGLMSSDFFDSVLSLTEDTNFESGTSFDKTTNSLNYNVAANSSSETLRLNYNYSPESGSSTTSNETPQCESLSNSPSYVDKNNEILLDNYLPKISLPIVSARKLNLNINPNGKKVIITKPNTKFNRRSSPNAKHIYKVQSISGNGRTLLLPFDITEMKNIKLVGSKDLVTSNLKIPKIEYQSKCEDMYAVSSADSIDDDSDSVDSKSLPKYPALVLTEEEKRLLAKEGIRLPTRYPLTKVEEKELKRIRRKIRNKISAQDSRKRKKEYVDSLEKRLKQTIEDKKLLINQVNALRQENNRLSSQMNKLQSLVFNTSKVGPTTSLFVVMMCILLISLPNLNITKSVHNEQQVAVRRTLLSSPKANNEDSGSLDEFLLFNPNNEPKITMFEEESISEACDSNAYFDQEYEHFTQKAIFTNDIAVDVRKTYSEIKRFMEHVELENRCEEEIQAPSELRKCRSFILDNADINTRTSADGFVTEDSYDKYVNCNAFQLEK